GRAKAWCGFFGRRFFSGINGARNWHHTGTCSGDAPGQTTALLHNPRDLVAFLQVWTSLVRTDRSLFTEARLQFFSGVLKAVRIFA
ncbi:hypothetical protein ACJX0J_038073, partial [Zea mays]